MGKPWDRPGGWPGCRDRVSIAVAVAERDGAVGRSMAPVPALNQDTAVGLPRRTRFADHRARYFSWEEIDVTAGTDSHLDDPDRIPDPGFGAGHFS